MAGYQSLLCLRIYLVLCVSGVVPRDAKTLGDIQTDDLYDDVDVDIQYDDGYTMTMFRLLMVCIVIVLILFKAYPDHLKV